MSYTLTSATQSGLGDRICLYKLPHLQPHEHVAFVWAANSEEKTLKAKFPVSALPEEAGFYKFGYLKTDNHLAGSSVPFQLALSERSQLDVLTRDKLLLEQTLTQTTETLGRTENDLNTSREELVEVQQSLKEKEYKIFELEDKLKNGKKIAVNENIKLLTRERDSLKSKLNEEIMAHENLLKETKELKDSMARETDSLKRKMDDAIMVRENLLKDIRELAFSRAKERDSLKSKLDEEAMAKENLLKKIRQLDDSRAKERDSHISE